MTEGGGVGERRWNYRRSIELDAEITDPAGQSRAARLGDLSEEGCMILALPGDELTIGDIYDIAITGFETLVAQVVWAGQGKAGLAFITPLTAAEIEKLVMASLYARLTKRGPGPVVSQAALDTLPPFPFKD
jgi:hypothetical protein